MADETMRSEDRQATGVGAGSLHIGIDVGSTTVKLAILDEDRDVKFSVYRRHHADVRATIVEVLAEAAKAQDAAGGAFGSQTMTIAITGSGGLLLAQWLGVEFVQEVIASKTAVETFIPATDVAIELGGEDAKIIYFDQGIEQRMNGTCAGGTGAFIDQMASLLNTDAGGLNELAPGRHHHLSHRQPLRRVRQDRRPAAAQRRRAQGGHRRVHLPVGGHADHLRLGVRPAHPRQRRVPGRPAAVPSPNCASASTKRWSWTRPIASCRRTRICSSPAAAPWRARPARPCEPNAWTTCWNA